MLFLPFMCCDVIVGRYLLGQDDNYPTVNFNSKDSTSPINQVNNCPCSTEMFRILNLLPNKHVNVEEDHAR